MNICMKCADKKKWVWRGKIASGKMGVCSECKQKGIVMDTQYWRKP